MPISGTTTNYAGRKKDLHVFQNVNPNGSAVIKLQFGKISNFCAGVQKLAQRYGISLLTALGSQEGTPLFGTKLLPSLSNRRLHLNKADVYPLFNQASNKVLKEFKRYQSVTPNLPDDEKLNAAYLNDIILTNDGIQLMIQLVPVTAEPIQFLIPLPK